MKNLTISQKIAFGFTALILVTALLGGLAVASMRSVQTASRTLATEYMPEVNVASQLKSHVAAANLAIRSYGFTADEAYLTEARKQLEFVHRDLKTAEALVVAHPNLVRLQGEIGQVTTALKTYEQAVSDTHDRNADIKSGRSQLDSAAAGFTANIDRLIEAQRSRLQAEISAASDATKLSERSRKLILSEEIRSLGNAARTSTFKAQALREESFFDEALKHFETVEAKLTELRGLLKVKADLDELDQVKVAALTYRDAVKTVMESSRALVAIGKVRAETAAKLLSLAEETESIGMKRTVDAADASDQRLSLSATTIFIGIGVALLVGFIIAFFIIRGTTKVLTSVADSMSDSSAQVTAAATQIAAASQTLAEASSEQAASLEETSASLEEMASMTKRNAESAQQAKELSTLTRHSADTGAAHMGEMRLAMDAIKASSADIAKIIKTIDEIAFQTNILALNAAVEAARAGDAGMGFAVVAEEVRSLAQRSAQSAKETAGKIEDAIRKSDHGVVISTKVAESLAEILAKARQVDSLIAEIATASAEQNQGIGQLNSAVAQMDKVTQNNASGAEETASAAEELNAQAASMQQAVAELRQLVTHRATSAESTPTTSSASAPLDTSSNTFTQPKARRELAEV